MEQFPHLKFIQKIEGKPRFTGGGGKNPQTEENKLDRKGHCSKLQRWTTATKTDWENSFANRESQNLAPINENVIPIFIQVNPGLISAEFNLESFGIEIISEEDEGFIIGASLDNFRTLEEKINGFLYSKHGTGKVADFWQIFEGNREEWKPYHILSEELYAKWNNILDDEIYDLEVSVAFDKPIKKEPQPNIRGYKRKIESYRQNLIVREDLLMQRESNFESFIKQYGKITSQLIQLDDSFGCEVTITGKGLKDLVVNYQFVFEVVEIDKITGIDSGDESLPDADIKLVAPEVNAIEVGIIDSGIMEGNKFINPAIKTQNSRSYLIGDNSTADHVARGGHGTKVAGAVLYPTGISSISSPYQLPCFIRNLRVLDANNQLPHRSPAELIQQIVKDNEDCKLFNLSISSNAPFRKRHMSLWATVIDNLIHERDVLFMIAVGNIPFTGVNHYLNNGKDYPSYLDEFNCRIANPAQSSFGITVGSINHCSFEDTNWKSLGGDKDVSGFSRIGIGIWGHIKPDVVEYGGGIVCSKNGILNVKEHAETATELIRSTLHGGNAFGRDSVGTSFSTPKVSHIAAKLMQLYPEEGVNLIRALIAQGARLPGIYFETPTLTSIKHFGYGLPSLERVTKNSEHRITFYSTAKIQADEGHLYSLTMPPELRGQGDEFEILIEVSLAYTGQVRRTRQKTKSYLSTWLDWSTSKIGESFDEFKDYALKEIEQIKTDYDADAREGLSNFDWKIKNRSDFGSVQEVSRNNSTLQKDWTILKSYELPKEITFAVRGHKGWDKNRNPVPYALSVSIEILGSDIPIYQIIKVANEVEIPV